MIFFNCKDFISKIHQQSSNITAVTFFSSIFFLSFVFVYANLVYIQFSFFEIFKVFILFFLLIFLLILAFNYWDVMEVQKLELNTKNIFWSLIVFLFLIFILYSPNEGFDPYFRTFPLLDVETGFGWHKDSVFHVSIINSFVNFNYPSIGQHDAPVIVYHTLSHFVDSLIVRFAGVDAWDSYGLLYFFKSAFLLPLILILITSNCKRKNLSFIFYFSSILIMTPLIIGSWHLVSSHGLWFTSFLIISSASFLFKILNEDKLSIKHYLIIILILILVSLGKISSGFSYTLLIGFFLLLKDYKDYRVYLFGFIMMLFFYLYGSQLGTEKEYAFDVFNTMHDMSLLKINIYHNELEFVYIVSFLTFVIGYSGASKVARYIALSGLFSALVLSIFVAVQPSLSKSDIFYFVYGLSSVLVIFSFQSIISASKSERLTYLEHFKLAIQFVIFTALFMLLIRHNSAKFNIVTMNNNSFYSALINMNNHPFLHLQKQLNLKDGISIKRIISSKTLPTLPTINRPLLSFKLNLKAFMKKNELGIQNTLLYIPKEIFEKNLIQFKGEKWARGMMIYAITEVPLIHGLYVLRKDYGYADYDDNAKWLSRTLFDKEESCKFEKDIIIVETLTPPKFSLIRCN